MTLLPRAGCRFVLSFWLATCLLPSTAIESSSTSGLMEAFRVASLGLEELFVVVPITAQKVLIVGRDAAGTVSIRAFDHARNESQTLVTEDAFFSNFVRNPWYVQVGIAPLNSQPAGWLAVVLYQVEDPASGSLHYETHLRLLILSESGLEWSTGPEKIAETSISYWETDPSGKWLRARRNSGVGDDGVGEPAIKELVRVFARDATGDGFPDVVVWKRSCRSVLASAVGRRNAECGLELEPVGQVVLIAPYQQDGSFGPLRAGEVAGLRNARAWESGLGRDLPQEAVGGSR